MKTHRMPMKGRGDLASKNPSTKCRWTFWGEIKLVEKLSKEEDLHSGCLLAQLMTDHRQHQKP
eukprot:815982-Pelagomonas_calceolata.AAC.1